MKSKADIFDNHKGRLFQIHSQLQSFCITQNGKTSSGKCSITMLSSVSVLSVFPAPAWANTCGKRRQFPLFQQCLTLPTPAPARVEHVTAASCALKPNITMEVQGFLWGWILKMQLSLTCVVASLKTKQLQAVASFKQTLNQHLICVALWQLPQNRQGTVTKASLRFVSRKNKHKGSFYFRNGKETGKHRWEIVALSQ